MKAKKLLALTLAGIFICSTSVYASDPASATEQISEAAASCEDETTSYEAAIPETAPAFEEAETSAETPAEIPTDNSLYTESEISAPASEAEILLTEPIAEEELVGAPTYRSIYESCFEEVYDLNRQLQYECQGSVIHYTGYSYTLLDLNYDGIKELIVNGIYHKHGKVYYVYTINTNNYTPSLIGKVYNDSWDPIATNGSRIAFIEYYKGNLMFLTSPFTGSGYIDPKIVFDGSASYNGVTTLKQMCAKYFTANAVISPEFIDTDDISLLNNAGTVTRFSDVTPKVTAHNKEVYWAAAKGITKGYPGTALFGINDTCTRGEAMMFLWRLAGKPSPKSASKSPFSDVPTSHAYYKAILWAAQKGITKGYSNGTFGINTKCTRGQIATFIWRYKGSTSPKSTKSTFKDAITPAYKNAVLWAAEKGITKGYPDGTFRDKQNCTRGEIVTFLYRVK